MRRCHCTVPDEPGDLADLRRGDTGGRAVTSPRVLYPGTGGSTSVTVSNGVYRWHGIASCASCFEGKFSITDLTSGLSGGFSTAIALSRPVATTKLKEHRYSGTLSGVASNFLVPCAWTGPNNTICKFGTRLARGPGN